MVEEEGGREKGWGKHEEKAGKKSEGGICIL